MSGQQIYYPPVPPVKRRLSNLPYLIGMFSFALLLSCQSDSNQYDDRERLAKIHCSSCHLFPKPELLPKETWETYVLPRMGYMMGIYANEGIRESLFEGGGATVAVKKTGLFPSDRRLTENDWKKIQEYFLDMAPDTLAMSRLDLRVGLPQFLLKVPDYSLQPPSTTLIHIKDGGGIFIGDVNSKSLLGFDKDLSLELAAKTGEAVVDWKETDDLYLLTVMGSFSPTDSSLGYLLGLPKNGQGRASKILDHLQRPVNTVLADLNEDGRMDLIVSEYAKWSGGLSWWEQSPEGLLKEHVLKQSPGAMNAYTEDINGDDMLDIVALFGQGDEGVFAFLNQGNGVFREQALLRFPASYGSSYFALWDADNDGDKDILYTAGDNADYPPIAKPYHGVYLFENDGDWAFTESLFIPIQGAYKAIPEDFDQDGDSDIAVNSFFPDYSRGAKEGFVYLQNQGENQFIPYTFPEVASGRWLVMDVGDVDSDGDMDIALGSLVFEAPGYDQYVEAWIQNGIPFVILENQLY